MEILNLTQGTPEWHAARMKHFCASEAPAMLGLSKYMTRNALLAMKKTGVVMDVDSGTQTLFDRGHAAEELARPIAEQIIGEDLYPCTGRADIEGLPLLASFDGLTMCEDTTFEHKLYAKWLADYLAEHNDLPDTHWPQVEHQFIVSGAERCLFMVSDGTKDNEAHIFYESNPERRFKVIAGWHQFEVDLESFEPAAPAPQIVAAPIETLPSVSVQVTGSLAVVDNLKTFGDALQTYIGKINRKPETDQDFADCESAIKTLTKAEEALDAAESAALAQVECIDKMRMLKATLKDLARSNRLMLEKLVKAEKENRRVVIVQKAQKDLSERIALFPEHEYMPQVQADFGGVIKGLKTITSIQNAVDTELARVTIEATSIREKIRANLLTIGADLEYAALFADVRTLVLKDSEFVRLTVKQRIADHKAAEEKREEETRARIQAAADAKAKAEADRVIEVERAKIRAEEEARAKSAAPAIQEPAPVIAQPAPNTPAQAPNITQAAANTAPGATMSLGKINSHLAPISLTKDGLAALGIHPVGKERAAILYSEADMPNICAALVRHINAISLKKAA